MKVTLINECTTDSSNLQCNGAGYYCQACQKQVVDYSGMTDQQILDSVTRYGLGCGAFREDQLDRELIPRRKRFTWKMAYASIVALILMRSPEVLAQEQPKTEQTSRPHSSTATLNNTLDDIEADTIGITSRRFGGTAMVCVDRSGRTVHKPSTFWQKVKRFFTFKW